MTDRRSILVIDDQESAREILSRFLEQLGYRARVADSVAHGRDIVDSEPIAAVISDVRMPGADGLQGLRQLHLLDPGLPVIMVTAHATVESAVSAMKLGAFDYIRKPVELGELEIILARALEHRKLIEENRQLRAVIEDRYRLENMVCKSPTMLALFELIRKVGPADVPVLIIGESGTGKDLVARALHGQSRRAARTFLSINCAAVPESLLETELFGHERGAFSGAVRARTGYFRQADGGTLFLDEISDMSLGQQAKLLRVLESGEVMPVGSEHPEHTDVRVVAATHQDLEKLAAQGRFREDLLFRIETVCLRLPPLRERREDIPLLVAHFLERSELGARAPKLSTAAMRRLLEHDWPGNVRELSHAIEHAVLVAEGDELQPQDLPPRLRGEPGQPLRVRTGSVADDTYRAAREAVDRAYFSDVLARAGGSINRAAALAGIHRATLHKRLRKLRIGSYATEKKGERE